MKIKSIEIMDTHGSLKEPGVKHEEDRPALTGWFENEAGKRVLKLSPGNLYFEKLNGPPGKVTYKQILQYNGTLSTSTKTFVQTLVDESMEATQFIAPVLTYSPNGLILPDMEYIDEMVLDLSFHTGQADVLEYKEGSLTQGEKTYKANVFRHGYPAVIAEFPNVEDELVYLDGWYTYTFIRFIDVENYSPAVKGEFYAYNGTVMEASKSGKFWVRGSDIFILPTWIGTATSEDINTEANNTLPEVEMGKSPEDISNLRYKTLSLEGVGGKYSRAMLDSQVLITDEIRDAIVKEVLCTAKNDVSSACDFADWQKLTLKREAAFVMFENELFRNAQKIIESSRRVCKFRPNREC